MSVTVEKPGAVAARSATRHDSLHQHDPHRQNPRRHDPRDPRRRDHREGDEPYEQGSFGARSGSDAPLPRPSLEERVSVLDALGTMSEPVAVVDLDGIERFDLATTQQALDARAGDHRILIGVRSEPLPSKYTGPAWDLVEAMSTTIVPRGDALPPVSGSTRSGLTASQAGTMIEADDPHALVNTIVRRISGAPLAAVIIDDLLRQNATAPVALGLVNEAAALNLLPSFGSEPDPGGRVSLEPGDETVRVVVSHPEGANSFSSRICRQLIAALREVDPEARIELWVPAPDFCHGTPALNARVPTPRLEWHGTRMPQHLGGVLHHLRDRLLVRLHGVSADAGIELAAFADRLQATPDTRISLSHLRHGRIPQAGGTVSLTRRMGRWRTAALALSGMELDALTAHRWGLVDAVAAE